MSREEQKKTKDKMSRYRELFSKPEEKAKAFDLLAENFYAGNFGTMSKADIETLMFHVYIERILEKDEHEFQAYSDFRLSKELGITQRRVSSLKEKKQLKYPREFDWKESFAQVSENARYENGKIKIQIPDINLYYEVKNAVEESGGYVDVTLTRNLLKISPEYFLDLLVAVLEENDRDKIRRDLWERLCAKSKDREYLEREPLGTLLAGMGKEAAVDVVAAVLTEVLAPAGVSKMLGKTVSGIAYNIKTCLSRAKENREGE